MAKNHLERTGKPLILSVDDDSRIQDMIVLYVKKAGFDIACATSGAEALAQVKQTKPDLILLDVMMPGMSGYDVCSALQKEKETAYIPVVFVTALGEEADKARAFAVGAVDYLVKPFLKQGLLEVIAKHLKTTGEWKQFARVESPHSAEGTKVPAPRGAGILGDEHALLRDVAQFREYLAAQLRPEPKAAQVLGTLAANNLFAQAGELGLRTRDLAQHLADFLTLPYVAQVNPKDLRLGVLPTAFCKANSVVAVNSATADVAFVLSNPFDFPLADMLGRFSAEGKILRLSITEPENLAWIFKCHEAGVAVRAREQEAATLSVRAGKAGAGSVLSDEAVTAEDLAAGAEEAPVIKLANLVVGRAIQKGASDVHIEPRENSLGIRYRIDGMLIEQDAVPKKLQGALISRLKIMSKMDIAERRVPQDGSVRIYFQGRDVDLRVSTLPSRYGEKVVIRILDKRAVSLDFDALGFQANQLELLREGIQKPHGIILVTGPTGSGKTTTLYTALQALNEPATNIVTVEDPIEYEMHRVTQVQVNPDAGLTFPIALRSILRQDPDVIMVGEIRDKETLDIAIKAALTGHLVLSTLHTNDAPGTVIRLRDMAEPYLVAASLQLVVAQRLMRRLCPTCKRTGDVAPSVLRRFEVAADPDRQFFVPVGCDDCNRTGYKGRLATIEVMRVDEGMRKLISASADELTLRRHAIDKCGMIALERDAFAAAQRGVTSLEEVLGVTG